MDTSNLKDPKEVNAVVFPSEKKTIWVENDPKYNGAHKYKVRDCLGFANDKTMYGETYQTLQFVQKNEDGSIIPGLQSEQLALVMIDRAEKLNAAYPSEHNAKQIAGLKLFLEGCQDRIEERMARGVMGELKK